MKNRLNSKISSWKKEDSLYKRVSDEVRKWLNTLVAGTALVLPISANAQDNTILIEQTEDATTFDISYLSNPGYRTILQKSTDLVNWENVEIKDWGDEIEEFFIN